MKKKRTGIAQVKSVRRKKESAEMKLKGKSAIWGRAWLKSRYLTLKDLNAPTGAPGL
jgi:hypothetical protein